MTRFASAAKGLVLGLSMATCAYAQPDAGAFRIDDYYRLARFTQVALSSDGKAVAYTTQKLSLHPFFTNSLPVEELRRLRTTYLLRLDRGAKPVVLDDLADAQKLTWVPETRRLAFVAKQDGVPQLFTYDVESGRKTQVTMGAEEVVSFKFTADGRSLAYMRQAQQPAQPSYYEQFRTGTRGIVADSNTLSAYDFVNPFWNNMLRPAPGSIWIVRRGEKPAQVSIPGEITSRSGEFFWSTDGRLLSVSYVSADMPPSLIGSSRTSLGVYDSRSGQFRVLGNALEPTATRAGIRYLGGEWVPGTHRLLALRVIESDPWVSASFPDWTVIEVGETLSSKNLAWRPVETYGMGTRFFPVSATHILVEKTSEGVHTLFDLKTQGIQRSPRVAGLDGSSSDFDFSADFSRITFVHESLTRPPELYVRDGQGPARQLTALNAEVAKAVRHTSREYSWKSTDGVTARGWLLEPAGVKGPMPLITHVHGGPGYANSNAFAPYYETWPYPFEVQAARGMAIFLPNYRGTMTYGRAFGSPKRTDQEPVDDIITGIKQLIAEGIADPERLGITGQSHGSWLGPLAMAKHHIFKASSFAEGISSKVIMYELMSGDLNRQVHDSISGLGKSLYESPQPYIEGSPDLQFAGLRTASLFESGAYSNAIGMLGFPKAARRGGAPTEFIIYPQTDHNPGSEAIQRESAQRNLEWFEFWLLGQEDAAPEKAEQYARWRSMRSYGE